MRNPGDGLLRWNEAWWIVEPRLISLAWAVRPCPYCFSASLRASRGVASFIRPPLTGVDMALYKSPVKCMQLATQLAKKKKQAEGYMFHCPLCKLPAHVRTSRYLTENLKQRYHQCTSIECSATFRTTGTLDGVIRRPVMPETPVLRADKQQ